MTNLFFFEFECANGVPQVSPNKNPAIPNGGKFLFVDDDFYCTVSEGINITHGEEDFFRGVIIAPNHDVATLHLQLFMETFEPPF